MLEPRSYRMGSLKLYKDCVKHILPGKASKERISRAIAEEIEETAGSAGTVHEADMHGRNGEIRVQIRQISRADTGIFEYDVGKGSSEDRRVPTGDRRDAADAILKVDPERIHTIIPGYIILQSIADHTAAKKITVSSYGVREGYLCQKILG